jgi:hypothetical protein
MRFESAHVISGHFGRDPEMPRRRGNAASFHGSLEHRHADQPVHVAIPKHCFGETEA